MRATRRVSATVVLGLFVFAPFAPHAHQGQVGGQVVGLPQQPPRDAPPPRPGAGAIGGVVTASDSGLPLEHATVMLLATTGGFPVRAVATDSGGRFVFNDVAAGTYRLRVVPGRFRGQYLQATYGGTFITDPGESIDLVDGQRVENADIALPRGAAIGGRVLDEFGEPVSGLRVQAHLVSAVGGIARGASSATTDDRGAFRLFGLMAGDYIVTALGRSIREHAAAGDGGAAGFPNTSYPSALHEHEAKPVHVQPGGESEEILIRLSRMATFSISGTMVNAEGEQLHPMDVALTRPDGTSGTSSLGLNINHSGGDVRFTIPNVTPGEYRLAMQATDAPGAGGAARRRYFAAVPVNVSANIEGLVVVAAPAVDVHGSIVFEQGTPRGPASSLRVQAQPAESRAASSSAAVGADLGFVLREMFGLVRVGATGLPPGHAVRAVMLGQDDVTHRAVDLAAHAGHPLRLIVTGRVGDVEGLVRGEDDASVRGSVVLVIPDDRAAWRLGPGAVQVIRPADGRRFVAGDVVPGRYHLVALPPEDAWVTPDSPPAAFEALMKQATTVDVREGETATVELTILRGAR
jgi:hypothetical protein